MNILYIAFSCSPYHGSEDKIGWNIPMESAKKNKVFVITRESQRKYIEKYLRENPVQNLAFYYVAIPPQMERLLSCFPYTLRLNLWHRKVFPLAKKICREEKIKIIHQITPVEFRSIGKYGIIPEIKYVAGPIAGAQRMPEVFFDYLDTKAQVIERLREFMNYVSRKYYRFLDTKVKCDDVLFSNEETHGYLKGVIEPASEDAVLVELGTDKEELQQKFFAVSQDGCHFLVAGRLVYLKGHAFLLDAMERIPKDLNYQFHIVGDGPLMESLCQLCIQKDLSDKVTFLGKVPYVQMKDEYNWADVLVFPSFREASGSVILEAMSKGVPVITINKFGGAVLLDDSCGWLYSGETKEEYIEALKNALIDCITHPDEVARKGENAFQRAHMYTWEEKCKRYQLAYDQLLEQK